MTIDNDKSQNVKPLIESEMQVLATASLQKEVDEELKGDPTDDNAKASLLVEGEKSEE